MTATCVFCRIINKEIPANPVLETDDIIIIKDINPKAPIHYLIIPKKHIQDVQSLHDQDAILAANMLLAARELCRQLPGSPDFKLVVNSGKSAGQCVFHVHIHFLAGKQFGEV